MRNTSNSEQFIHQSVEVNSEEIHVSTDATPSSSPQQCTVQPIEAEKNEEMSDDKKSLVIFSTLKTWYNNTH